MNYGSSAKEFLIEKIIQLLIRKPMVTSLEIQKVLESNGYPKLTESYIGRLRKIANARLLQRAHRKTKMIAHAEYMGTIEETLSNAWNIAASAPGPGDRLRALVVVTAIAKQRYELQLAADEFDDDAEARRVRAILKEEKNAATRAKTSMPTEDIDAMNAAAEKSGFELPEPKTDTDQQEGKINSQNNDA